MSIKKHIPITKKELKDNTESFMKMLENNPSRIANYFKHPKINIGVLTPFPICI